MKKLLLIPLAALVIWGGTKLYHYMRPPTVSEMIRSVHESLPPPVTITPTAPDVKITWPTPEKRHVQPKRTPVPAPRPLVIVADEPEVPVAPRCLFWIIGEPGCIPQ